MIDRPIFKINFNLSCASCYYFLDIFAHNIDSLSWSQNRKKAVLQERENVILYPLEIIRMYWKVQGLLMIYC